jgi:hypothetical protein
VTDIQQATFEICDLVSEIEAICYDHFVGGKYSPDEALAKIYDLLREEGLLRARRTVRYFPEDTPPPVTLAGN